MGKKDVDRSFRVLALFDKLQRGEIINKKKEVNEYNVDEATIRRDIKTIRNYLENRYKEQKNQTSIKYSKREKGYILEGDIGSQLSKKEVMAVAKVLLDSRALTKEEMDNLLDKILLQSNLEDRNHVEKIIHNERFYYIQLKHKQPLVDSIWDLSMAIKEQRLVEISYIKSKNIKISTRTIMPLEIIFSEYYFYLIAKRCDGEYDSPAIYRIDRIKSYNIKKETYTNEHSSSKRFSGGEFRKRVQFMKPGELMTIRFKFSGSWEALQDRLPTAKEVRQDGQCRIVDAEVYGNGIKMWLLSQGDYVDVISPKRFREEMKKTIMEMYKKYKD